MLLQLFFLLAAPYLFTQLTKRLGAESWLTPVLVCYAIGILLGNAFPDTFDERLNKYMAEGTVVLAIPLLLFGTDFRQWLSYAKSTLLGFLSCVLAGLLMAFAAAFLFNTQVADVAVVTSMLTGFFTGGAPNMNAIGIALNAEESLLVYLNVTDIICGGALLLFLSSFAKPVLSTFLPAFQPAFEENTHEIEHEKTPKIQFKDYAANALLAFAVVALALGTTYLFYQELTNASIIILLLSAFAVAASFIKAVRERPGSFEMGDYLLLIFCVAIGLQANFNNISSQILPLLAITAFVMYGTFLLHLLFCYLLRIDRDTSLITAVAAIYGPAFIGQIASVIKNRKMLLSGISTGLIGYAIGNFLGLGMNHLLQMLLQ